MKNPKAKALKHWNGEPREHWKDIKHHGPGKLRFMSESHPEQVKFRQHQKELEERRKNGGFITKKT